jgi:hypothetical protein
MSSRVHTVLWVALLSVLLPVACHAREARKQIKVLRVGSSSFPYLLMEYTRAIVQASGKYELVSAKEDTTGYTRLDQFISQPGLFDEWCREHLPKIRAGNYDFVIIQTIGWLGLQPDQQDRLCTQIIPELAGKIQDTGARVILYDKYLPVQYGQKDPRARTWCGRYPEGYRLNYLLHIMAAKHAGIDKITFGGQAVTELWQQEHFDRLSFLYCDSSHPGPMANYISALNLAYLLGGESPVGSPVRHLPLGEGRERAFLQLPTSPKPGAMEMFQANKDRIGDGILTLTEDEAKMLQEAAARSQQEWGALLQKCLESDAEYAEVLQEIRRIQGEMGKYEEYGLDAATVANLRQSFAPPAAPGELPPSLIAKIRRKSRSIEYAGADVRNYCRKFLTREQQKEVREAYANYWLENNSKLRDDLYFGCRVLIETALRNGDRDEAARLQQACGVLHMTLSFPAYLMLFENVSDQDKRTILEAYQITGGTKRSSPLFAAYQNEHHLDEAKLAGAWKVYMDIWSDPDRMDKLRENAYPLEVVQEADREFAKRIAED